MLKIILIILGFLILSMVFVSLLGNAVFKRQIRKEARRIFEKVNRKDQEIVSEDDIRTLPAPVQRYLRYSEMVGKEKIRTVKLTQGGYFRLKKEQKWMSIRAEQYFNVDSVEFVWWGKVSPLPLLSFHAKDEFVDGKGNLMVKLLGLVKIVDARGPEVDQGEILRFLGECVWFPSAFLNDYFRWEPIDEKTAKVTLTYRDIDASAIFHFNDKGEIVRINAKRYMEIGGKFLLRDWEISILKYRTFHGIKIPIKVDVVWKLDSGDFCYDRVEIINIEYNR